jgi:hypothetical protein
MPMPSPNTAPPSEEALVEDLETWRREGVLRLRHLRLTALSQAALAAGLADDLVTATRPAVLQDLVRSAIAVVAGSLSGRCATVLLGLDPNTFDLAPNLLREEAADIYGLSLERFRRNPQTRILTIVATQILEACYAHGARLERLALERRHPADSRLAIKWLERFEAYFTLWTPIYGLGADLTAYRSTLLDPRRPYDREPGTNGPDDPGYTQEGEALHYGTYALFHLAVTNLARHRWVTKFGGLWLLSSPQAEVEVRDALDAIRANVPMDERDDSWLATVLDEANGQLHPFLNRLADDPVGAATHDDWQEWLASCDCRWDPADEQPAAEYFPTGRYHQGIGPDCLVHCVVGGCNRYCTIIEDEWQKVADWYTSPDGASP